MRIGIIGVGHLGAVLAGALGRVDWTSARGQGAAVAERLGARSGTAAEVVAGSDVVLLAVRPKDAVAAVRDLPWRSGQVLVSACAGVPVAAFDLPGVAVHRIMPLTAAAQKASPTVLYPASAAVEAVIAAFGPVVPVETEAAFEVATVSAAMYGWIEGLIRAGAEWSAAQGLPEATARRLVALTAVAAGRNVEGSPESMAGLMAGLATPGGITELGLGILDAGRVPATWETACDAVLAKLRG